MNKTKRVVLLSGGHASALVAIEVSRLYEKEDIILLNHNISGKVEHEDIKRFKEEVANYIGVPITYANMKDWEKMDPLDVCMKIGAFKVGNESALCTYYMKTKPFQLWLRQNFPVTKGEVCEQAVFYYGFSKEERTRITRRVGVMASMGYKVEFPLASMKVSSYRNYNSGYRNDNTEYMRNNDEYSLKKCIRTIFNIEEVGIKRPSTYDMFRHANCKGCLKAGRQQFYIIYCTDYEYFEKAKRAEREIGYSILKDVYLEELECKFKQMKDSGIVPTEAIGFQTFWSEVRKVFKDNDILPCECAV